MADATQGDTDVQYLGLLVSALITLIAGLLIHSFIIGVNVSDWWKGRSLTPVDHIVTSIGMSRICTQCATYLNLSVVIYFPHSDNLQITLLISVVVYTLFAVTNFLLTSLLSIVLCLKISNFHSRLFLYLRGVIIHRTGSLIAACIFISAINGLMTLVTTIPMISSGGTYNMTLANTCSECIYLNSIYVYIIIPIFPLLFNYISSVLLFFSLYNHTTKMKMSSNLSISLETYYSAMRFMSVTFLYTTVYFLCYFACIIYHYLHYRKVLWFYVVLGSLPVLHSSYLIYRTPKLRSQMSTVRQKLTYFLFQSKDTETSVNIEVVALRDKFIK